MTIGVSAISVLRNRDFRLYALSSLLSALAAEILVVAIGWSIYDISRDPIDLGNVYLVQFLPSFFLVLLTGAAADRYPRKTIVALCQLMECIFTLGIFLVANAGMHHVWPILILVAGLGASRAFYNPAALALAPTLVERAQIPSAIACSTSSWQLSAIAGPALGGVLYDLWPFAAYTTALVMAAAATIAVLGIRKVEEPRPRETATLKSLAGGFRFMLREKVVLGASSLDLFAVLLGSVVALLPVFARDILVAGPIGLGLLRAGIGIGALPMAIFLGLFPIRRRAGWIMFTTVAVFGISIVVFGFSRWIWLSVAALIVMGASDMISVYIREVLVQLWTPDPLRGRVNAVYTLMITASNELGGFRAGLAAKAFGIVYMLMYVTSPDGESGRSTLAATVFGVVAAVVVGGICTLAVAALWARWFPAIRNADDLTAVEQLEPELHEAAKASMLD
jgi:MFS family permease